MSALRVLVVDDSTQDLMLFRFLLDDLAAQGFGAIRCDEASDGQRALQLLHEHDYDLIVLDQQMMLGLNGAQVMEALPAVFTSGRRRPKVVAYSNCDVPEFQRRCVAQGADVFAPKYLEAPQFASILRSLQLA